MTSASEYFGAMAADYDSLVHRAIPRYDEMIERIIAYMPGEAQRVLELGCGTGTLSVAVAERYPDAELTLVDASPEMLSAARARLGPERIVHLVESRFEDVDVDRGAFDLVTSGLALHHVADKVPLFRDLHAFLRPGGTLLYGDQMGGGTDAFSVLNWNAIPTR